MEGKKSTHKKKTLKTEQSNFAYYLKKSKVNKTGRKANLTFFFFFTIIMP